MQFSLATQGLLALEEKPTASVGAARGTEGIRGVHRGTEGYKAMQRNTAVQGEGLPMVGAEVGLVVGAEVGLVAGAEVRLDPGDEIN